MCIIQRIINYSSLSFNAYKLYKRLKFFFVMLPVPPQEKYGWMQNNFCYWVKAMSIELKYQMSKKPDFIGEVWGCLGHSWLWVLITWLWPQFQLFHWALWSSSVSLLSSTSLDPTGFPLNISPNSSTLLHWLPVLQCSLSSCLPCFASYTFALHKGLFHDTVSQTTQAAITDTRDWVT